MHLRLAITVLLLTLGCGGDAPPETVEETPPESATTAPTPGDEPGIPAGAEAISFLGDTLESPELPAEVEATYRERYAQAEAALERTPENVDSLIWMGRRTAYLGRYREAIDIFTHALELHPDEPRLYRHRGHRYLTVRAPDQAVADFERAAELVEGSPDQVEPDGLPNAAGIPVSTLHFNIFYHLGLAHYVAGRFEEAAEAYRACAAVSENDDTRVATAYWRYMTLQRLGRDAEAAEVLDAIDAGMDPIESTAYLQLLLLFQGEGDAEAMVGGPGEAADLQSTTTAYGVGMWYLLEGDRERAQEIFRRIVDARDQWPAFGYLAAEAELAELGSR